MCVGYVLDRALVAISNILIFLSGVLYCIAAMNIVIYCNIVILYIVTSLFGSAKICYN